MAKKRKSVRMVIGIVLIAIAVILIVAQFLTNTALKAGIEIGASKALKVNVGVSDVEFSMFAGSLEIEGLTIDNPQGYQYEKLLELTQAKVKVGVASLMSDEVHIEQIKLDGINLVIEQKGLTNNLQEIIGNLDKAVEPKAKEPKKKGQGKQLVVDDLKITNVTVTVKMLPVPGKQDSFEIKLQPIEMKNLGSNKKLDMVILSNKILVAIANGIAEQGTGVLPKEIIGQIESGLEEITQLDDIISSDGQSILEKGKNIGETVTEGLKNLFKPKED